MAEHDVEWVKWCRENPFLEAFEQLDLNIPDLVNEGIKENLTGSWPGVGDWLTKEGLELQQWLNRYEEVKTTQDELKAFNAKTPPITLLTQYLNDGIKKDFRKRKIHKAYVQNAKALHPDKVIQTVSNWDRLSRDEQNSKMSEATAKMQALSHAETNLNDFDVNGWWLRQYDCYLMETEDPRTRAEEPRAEEPRAEEPRARTDPLTDPSSYAIAARTGVVFGLFALLDKVFIRNRRRSFFRKIGTGMILSGSLEVLFSLVDTAAGTELTPIYAMAIVAVIRAVHTGLKSGGDIVTQTIAILRDNERVQAIMQLAGMHMPSPSDLRQTYDKLRARAKAAPPVLIAVVAVMVLLLGLKLRRVPRRLW
jgi:predicted MPP superfamily phosphohydrolase